MTILPSPYKIVNKKGEYEFGTEVTLFVNKNFKHIKSLELWKKLWESFTFNLCKLNIVSSDEIDEDQAIISTSSDGLKSLKFLSLEEDFEYSINVSNDGIYISGTNELALIHSLSTILQMIEPVNTDYNHEKFVVSLCEIYDKPALKFRGIHICVFPETSLLFLKKVVRLCGFYKYTHIVLEFWGMLKLDAMKELSWKNAYTKEQIKPIIKDANDFGIEIIPMYNHLGHASASRVKYGKHVVLDQDPRKALLFEPDGWTWCISNNDTITLLKHIREELIDLCGEGEYFHLGFDEAYSLGTCRICRQKNKIHLYKDYINMLSQDLKRMGRKGILWGDTLLDASVWKRPDNIASSKGDQITHPVLDELDRDIIIADWQYYIRKGSVPTSAYFIEQGFQTLLSPWDNDENMETLSMESQRLNALGVLGTTWHTLNENFSLLPYLSECMWLTKKSKSISRRSTLTPNASILRKLVLAKGIYEDAGWRKNEIDI